MRFLDPDRHKIGLQGEGMGIAAEAKEGELPPSPVETVVPHNSVRDDPHTWCCARRSAKYKNVRVIYKDGRIGNEEEPWRDNGEALYGSRRP